MAKGSLLLAAALLLVPAGQEVRGAGVKGQKKAAGDTTTCQLIEKSFINKAAKTTRINELYLRCSVRDYFIKLCEGRVSAARLRPHLGSGVTVKMDIRKGMLDHCHENPARSQSRTGTYVVIQELVQP